SIEIILTIGACNHGVQTMVVVQTTEPCQKYLFFIWLVISVLIRINYDRWCAGYNYLIPYHGHTQGSHKIFILHEHLRGFCHAISVLVFEDNYPIAFFPVFEVGCFVVILSIVDRLGNPYTPL